MAEVLETGGLPAVFAESPAATWTRRPPPPSWSTATTTSSRWSRSRSGTARRSNGPNGTGRLLGRGASDDKGQVLIHSLGVRAALAASGATAPPVTIKLIVEGEEESGSEHFAALLRRERERHA